MKLDGIREKVFLDRYALKDVKGNPVEKTPDEMWRRVAKAIARVEKPKDRKKWEKKFYDAMYGFKFLPGGRILSGAGTGYDVTYFNCFVIPNPPDSRGGIMQNLTQMIEIMARAGGVGVNLSSLRPRGARVKKVNGFSSGPLNWAELYSLATKDIVQQGGCFTFDTKIMTHLGLVNIEEIVKNKKSYYAATHQGFKKITTKFDNGLKDVFLVETTGGYKVRVTKEHKFLTFDKGGHFFVKPLAEFKKGESMVLLPSIYPNDIPEVILNTSIPKSSKFSYGRKSINLPKTLSEKLAFILGVYASDGSRIKDDYAFAKGLRFSVDQKRVNDIALLHNAIERVFGLTPIHKQGDGKVINLHIYSRNVVEFLRLNNLIKDNSNKVFVPGQIFISPKSVVEAFIAGVFFGDGYNRGGKEGFRICSVNKKFLEDVSLLLLNLGIASKITKQKREKWQDLYTVSINGNLYMNRFFNLIKDYSEKAYDNKISERNGFYNFPLNILKRFAYLSGIQRTIAYSNPTTSNKTLAFMEQRENYLQDEDVLDVEILTSTITDKIKSITFQGKEQVYDLEVNQTHLLSGNGFYTSNSRRGALMLMLHDWHPDIEEFITVKQDLNKINGANLSVCVSDAFMEAVKKDADWDLIFPDLEDPKYDKKWTGDIDEWKKIGGKVKIMKTVKAKYLWDLICTAAWRSAEPGLHFLDRSNKRSNTWYFERLSATNPCGEQPLSPWAVCNLGAMNLAAYVDKKGEFGYVNFGKDVRTAMRFLDNVIDDTYYFYKENEKVAKDIRRTGLGILGLADALIKMKVKYGSDESLKVIEKIFKTLRDNAYIASSDIAAEKGSFPKYNKEKYLQGWHIKKLPEEIRKKITKQGIRNAVLLTIAPTGTTSLISGVSSGVEPVYEFEFIRRDRLGEHKMYHPLFEQWKKENPKAGKPEYFVSANDLTPEEHVKVQAVAQDYIDSSISKTVNAPKDHTVEDVKRLYTLAYDEGLKGITYMRDGSREGVLERIEEKKVEVKVEPQTTLPVIPRPMMVEGVTYQSETPVGKTFITINHNENRDPFEVFITVGKSGSDVTAMADALGRMISLNLRLNGALSPRERVRQIVAQLIGIGGARSVGFGANKVLSLPDAVAKVLSKHFEFRVNGVVEDRPRIVSSQNTSPSNGYSNGHIQPVSADSASKEEIVKLEQLSFQTQSGSLSVSEATATGLYDICPECGAASLAYEEGCKKCYACGYSEC